MDKQNEENFRIGPTIQQGGTQTIQQSIYLAHNNPCGVNKLIYQKMGLTGIRYIDLKDYMDEILNSEEMMLLFEEIRIKGTAYVDNPTYYHYQSKFVYAIQNWAEAGLRNLSIPVNYYNGYKIRFSVFDEEGCSIYDSFFPIIKPVDVDSNGEVYYVYLPLLDNPWFPFPLTAIWPCYKLCNNPNIIPYLKLDGYQSNKIS